MSIETKTPTGAATGEAVAEYHYGNAELGWAHNYLLPTIGKIIASLKPGRVFELGCGNGSVANWLNNKGHEVVGIDYSAEGIAHAKKAFPNIRLEVGSAYDDLLAKYGKFPMVISLEVVEHLYSPRIFAKNVYEMLEPEGSVVISTPYHGYWENLALALTGKLDQHFTALWDGGHIKFWSGKTISELLNEAGFVDIKIYKAGRIPALAKSMVVVARKPRQ